MAITQAEAEATLENALSEMNETLAFLAEHGFEATLRPDGPIFEAYLATPEGIVIIRPKPRPGPANEP